MKFTFTILLFFFLILHDVYATPITQITQQNLIAKREADSKEDTKDDRKSEETELKDEKSKENGDDDKKDEKSDEKEDKSGETTTADLSEETTTDDNEVRNSNETQEDKKSKESGEKCKGKQKDDDSTEECEDKTKESIESDTSPIDIKICGTSKEADCKKLLVILVGGMRHDYIDRDSKLNTFEKIAERGVHIDEVRPVFPSTSLPNQFSILTGLYPDKHGIINDYMYDKKKKAVFTPDDYEEKFWWDDAEPFWITAKERKVAVYWWTGCELDVHGLPFRCSPNDDFSENKNHDDEVVNRLKDIVRNFKEDNYSLAMLNYENIDFMGRKYGPDSKQTRKAVRKLDSILEELLEEMEKQEMNDEMNVIILSDHGMTEKAAIIDLEKLDQFDENDFEMIVGNGAFVMLLPEKNRDNNVYEQLRNANIEGLNVYSKEKLKKRFRLRKNSLLLPIILTTDKGYLIQTPDVKGTVYPIADLDEYEGFDGFDPQDEEEMNTLMYAFGPSFKKNFTLEFAKTVDFFNLFCHLLDIERKDNDGSWSRIEPLLDDESDDNSEEETTTEAESDEDDSEAAANTKKADVNSSKPLTFSLVLNQSRAKIFFNRL
ncbi:ectonucleotide pyrophosphatase/phosphodiesterase family member 6-like isoform X1 [Leptotrombidium deliense]|uniref:glycerophosphocholine cholinephosphodiesterase n=1 Tax=Leptotrombidium deliense TaxID=299467 RepID=A0A443SWS0_9ACAR|nr:ectonucleotide pyrophosphatase/phosphodiesterase family member 6-like isoform X1 [Leptotrombidium deliense]